MAVRQWARWVLVGRRDGLRAAVRQRVGVFTWLDESEVDQAPSTAEVDPTVNGVGAPEEGDGWIRLLDRSELRAGDVLEVFADERALVLADVGGVVHAVDSLCPHAGGPLGDGQLEGPTLTCPWHGWAFDVRSGSCEVSDDVRLRTFPVRIDAGAVWVDIGREG